MKKLLALLMVLVLYVAPFSCNDRQVYAGLDGTSNYPTALDTSATPYIDVDTGDVVEAAHHDIQSDGIIKLQTKLGIGSYTPLANTALTCVTAGTSYWGEITPKMLYDNSAILPSAAEDGYCFTMTWNGGTPYFTLAACGAGGSGDEILINAFAVSPSATFTDGDIVWTFTDGGAGSDVVTATVACSGCIDITDIGANAVGNSEMADDAIGAAEMADGDHGDVSWSGGVATVENVQCTDCISDAEVVDTITALGYQPLDGTLTDISDGTLSGEVLSVAGASSGLTIGAANLVGDFNLRNMTTSAGYIDFFEDYDNGSNYLRLIAAASMADWTLVLPAADGTVGQLLKTDGSGALGWVDAGAAAAAGTGTEFQYRDTGNLGASAKFVLDGTANYPNVLDDAYMLFGSSDDFYLGFANTNEVMRLYTNDGASLDIDYALVTIGLDADNSGVTTNQELFEIGYGASDDSSANWVERLSLDKDGDLVIGGTFTPAGLINSAATGSTIKVSGTGSTWSLTNSIGASSVGNSAGGTYNLTSTGSSAAGSYLIGFYDNLTNVVGETTLQGALQDLDAAITSGGGGYADYIYEDDTRVETVDTGGAGGYVKMYTDNSTTIATAGNLRLPENFIMAWDDTTDTSNPYIYSVYGTIYSVTNATDNFNVYTGNLKVGNGTPGTAAMDGEDAYIEGQLEVDGATQFDGNADFNATANFAQITMDATATPAIYFNDSGFAGVQEGKILVNCEADDNCDMDFGVHSGSDTPTTVMKFDTALGETLIQLGTPGTNYVQITEAGAMSFVGTGSIGTISPTAATNDIGSTSAEWDDIFLGDTSVISFGAAQETSLTYTAASDTLTLDDNLTVTGNLVGGTLASTAADNAYLHLDEDSGTDWYLGLDDVGNTIELRTSSTVGDSVGLEITETTFNATLTGDLTVSGGNIEFGNIAGVLGDATTDSITLTTDGTGTAEVALPAGSIDSTEILDTTIAGVDLATDIDIPTAATIGTAYIYRVGGTDVADADVADNITITAGSQIASGSPTFTAVTSPSIITDAIDATGAVDMDYGSADITDHTFITDGGADSITIGNNADLDFGITINSDTNDFTLNWDEDNAELELTSVGDEDLIIDLDTATDQEVGISSSTGVTRLNFGSLNLITTGAILGAVNVVTTTDGSESPTAEQMYGTMFIADHGTATSDTTYTLPAVAAGMSACFYDNGDGTGGITIEIDDADIIHLNGTALDAGDTIDSPGVAGDGANGDYICIIAIDAESIMTIGRSGTWVDGGAT